jgi:hypothetical protein
MEFFSLQNRVLVIVLGLLLIASWGFGIFQYGVNHRWSALDFIRSSATQYSSAQCVEWFNLGQANLTAFTRSSCNNLKVEDWPAQCRDSFQLFMDNMDEWITNCSFDIEQQLK